MIRDHSWFTSTILMCIIVAGILVGIQTYDGMEEKFILQVLDFIILTVFCLEVVVKILAESTRPWLYFMGPDYKWNWFDFLIVVFSLPIPGLSGMNASFLRLLRLARITKIFKKIRQLQMIVSGLIHGLKSIVWILLLMLLIFYLFAVAAVIVFKQNDRFHFGNIPIAMVTLFRASTLEDWSDLMYINYFGCGDYGDYLDARPGYESNIDRSERGANITKLRINILPSINYREVFFEPKCTHSIANPFLSVLFFLSFLVVASFVMLSLFIGAVTMGMTESMDAQEAEIKAELHMFANLNTKEFEREIREQLASLWIYFDRPDPTELLEKGIKEEKGRKEGEGTMVASNTSIANQNVNINNSNSGSSRPLNELFKQPANNTAVVLKETVPQQEEVPVNNLVKDLSLETSIKEVAEEGPWDFIIDPYEQLAEKCAVIGESNYFKHSITIAILVASVLVGLSTEDKYSKMKVVHVLEDIILAIFIIELLVKVCACGLVPLHYFDDPW
eukprot:CAMPEP_0114339530 /NCGR_PEP_ID=MMETSP0101-20121206/7789_1 /TAXON_ID=38822 ORGANISM="Pteridomonas danica, Strain PT" /NCGR_SAMPLE_ID=MMETSP0101 /ASSEMBLY_ACC=CAM_ASM_000211 /LENGTH=503 /DNA_ID=CAMNT_0001472525 /DNA_START=724 /DNA_END=2232 /DNA_ORIENTATION=+